jgi:hypothetical protein
MRNETTIEFDLHQLTTKTQLAFFMVTGLQHKKKKGRRTEKLKKVNLYL